MTSRRGATTSNEMQSKRERLNLARKYRPQSLKEVVGQDSTVRVLEEALRADRIAPAYLFSGPRGVGKTTSARIFAKAASCLSDQPESRPCEKCDSCQAISQAQSMDLIEIDGASHTGVDDVRSIIEAVTYKPSIGARTVYIIDEVHMLSNAAFNALLKTLEEPPAHALFLFATTEPEKLPSTILSRVQRLELRRLPERVIVESLINIAKAEKIEAEEKVLEQIALAADGALRDAQTLLEQMVLLSASKKINPEVVDSFLGTIGSEQEIEILEQIANRNIDSLLEKIRMFSERGKDLSRILSRLVVWSNALLLAKTCEDTSFMSDEFPANQIARIEKAFMEWSLTDCDRLFEVLWNGKERIKRSDMPRVTMENTLLRASRLPKTEDIARLIKLIEASPVETTQQVNTAQAPAPTYNHKAAPKPQAPARPQPPTPNKQEEKIDLESIDSLLAAIKARKPAIHALFACATEKKLEGTNISLKVPAGHFALKQLSDSTIQADIKKLLKTLTDRDFSIEVQESSSSANEPQPPKEERRDFMKEAKSEIVSDPQVQKVAELLGGKIDSVNIEGIKT